MKTVLKTLLILSGFALTSSSLFALNNVVRDTVVDDTSKKDLPAVLFLAADEVTYVKIEIEDLPRNVRSAVQTKYAAYAIHEAYKGSDGSFKLILKQNDAGLTVYYGESGELKKEETCSKAQDV